MNSEGSAELLFEVQTRKFDNSLLSEWEPVDSGEFTTEAEAIEGIEEMKKLDEEWASAEYRVVRL
jgi:hypothetical protein